MAEPGAAPEQGASEQTGYAGFNTPEELASAYQSAQAEKESLSKQVTDLERMKGRHGTEIGQLREQIANLNGQLQAMNEAKPQNQGPSLDSIARQLQDGEIDDADAIRMASELTMQHATTQMGQILKQELGKRDEAAAREKYVSQFMSDNPGYQEAYENGSLQPWLDKGLSGEEAWDKFQLEATRTELQTLKQQAAQAAEEAKKAGLDEGIEIEKAKSSAGKVLDGKGGRFGQLSQKFDLSNQRERNQAGRELLRKMRTPGG